MTDRGQNSSGRIPWQVLGAFCLSKEFLPQVSVADSPDFPDDTLLLKFKDQVPCLPDASAIGGPSAVTLWCRDAHAHSHVRDIPSRQRQVFVLYSCVCPSQPMQNLFAPCPVRFHESKVYMSWPFKAGRASDARGLRNRNYATCKEGTDKVHGQQAGESLEVTDRASFYE